MVTRNEVELFLNQFKVKLDIWGVFFLDDREKNKQTMAQLGFRQMDRLNVVRSIEIDDYSQGPIIDEINGLYIFHFTLQNTLCSILIKKEREIRIC